jgi:autophagy-related protein 2
MFIALPTFYHAPDTYIPKTFEAVIPTDRTRIQVKILDSSIRAFAPNHPGAMVVYLQELEFSTDAIGDSRESLFRINATGLALLAADDISSQEVDLPNSLRGVSIWTVGDSPGIA